MQKLELKLDVIFVVIDRIIYFCLSLNFKIYNRQPDRRFTFETFNRSFCAAKQQGNFTPTKSMPRNRRHLLCDINN